MNHPVLLWWGNYLLALAAAPLLIGIINKVKAFFAGRKGPRLLQLYSDLFKLLKKGTVYGRTACGIFRIAPAVSLATLFCAGLFLPFGGCASPFAFSGDMLLFLYLLGMGRAMTVLGALDTGSSFEGMGAARECQFSVLAEGVILAVLGVLALASRRMDLSGMLLVSDGGNGFQAGDLALLLALAAFYIVALTECSRVPVDDPETHLELTMIHEVMVLDNSGPDLAFILYGSALKLWMLLTMTVLILPWFSGAWGMPFVILLTLLGAVSVGIMESIMARYRFLKVPQLLNSALGLAVLALALTMIFQQGGK